MNILTIAGKCVRFVGKWRCLFWHDHSKLPEENLRHSTNILFFCNFLLGHVICAFLIIRQWFGEHVISFTLSESATVIYLTLLGSFVIVNQLALWSGVPSSRKGEYFIIFWTVAVVAMLALDFWFDKPFPPNSENVITGVYIAYVLSKVSTFMYWWQKKHGILDISKKKK